MAEVALRDPWLVACWPGMASVALLAGVHLAKTLEASRLADVPADGFFDVAEVTIREGVLRPVAKPQLVLHAFRNPDAKGRDLLIFLSDAQPSVRGWDFCEMLLARARDHGVRRVVTFASLAVPTVPGTPSRVHAVATSPALLAEVRRSGAEPLDEGSIGGLNGVLLGAAAAHGLEGLCLLGTFPFMAPGVPNPAAAAAVLGAFAKISGVTVRLDQLEAQGRDVDRRLAEAWQAAQTRAPGAPGTGETESSETDLPAAEPEHEGLSAEDRRRIEHMFQEAQRSRESAVALKTELDRLGVFAKYEDRFLDLFKRGE